MLTIVGVITVCITYVIHRHEQKQSFFERYTDRYQRIIENLPDWVFTKKDVSYSDLVKEGIVSYLRAYYDLCSEEYYLHTKKRITQDVWKEWNDGIIGSFTYPAFRVFWNTSAENGTLGLYSEFVKYVNKELKDGKPLQ